MGDRTKLFLRLGARVVAVEPQAACIEALRRRFDSEVTGGFLEGLQRGVEMFGDVYAVQA